MSEVDPKVVDDPKVVAPVEPDPTMVPVSALQAERVKRQAAVTRADELEAKQSEAEAAKLAEQGEYQKLAEQRQAEVTAAKTETTKAQAELSTTIRKSAVNTELMKAGVGSDRLDAARAAFDAQNAEVIGDDIKAVVGTFIDANSYFKATSTTTVNGGPGHKSTTGGGDRVGELQTKFDELMEKYHNSDGHDRKSYDAAIKISAELKNEKKLIRQNE